MQDIIVFKENAYSIIINQLFEKQNSIFPKNQSKENQEGANI